MRLPRIRHLIVAIVFAAMGAAARGDDLAARVVIVANASGRDSIALANYYAEKRAIPRENIIALPMPLAETIPWRDFIATIHQPLQDELLKRGWLNGTVNSATDRLGRKRNLILDHRIAYLVVCRGVPLRIEHDPALYQEATDARRPEFRTNCSAVDGELALLANGNYAIDGLLANPLFEKDRPTMFELGKVVKVARLDGPGYALATALVDSAIAAEKHGLIGRGYVDIGGPYPQGDAWMTQTAEILETLGFDTSVDRAPTTIPATARFDAPVLYFGWYAEHVNGPFAEPGFRFPPGAVALHLHSFSARSMNTPGGGWTAPFVARGAAATVGNVHEPYLVFTHYPHLLLKALARGETFGDAAFYALPALSWQAVAIGDPLYRPFAVNFAAQWKRRAEFSPEQQAYLVLREMRQRERAGKTVEALELGAGAMRENPHLAIGVKQAALLKASGRWVDALQSLEAWARLPAMKPRDEPVLWEMVGALTEGSGEAATATFYATLLRLKNLPREFRRAMLTRAETVDRALGETARADEWARELTGMAVGRSGGGGG